jgi:hypothetical protein
MGATRNGAASRRAVNLIVTRLYQAPLQPRFGRAAWFYRSLQTHPKPRTFAEPDGKRDRETFPVPRSHQFARFPSLREIQTGVVLPEFRRFCFYQIRRPR